MNNFVKSLFVLILFSSTLWLVAEETESKEASAPADAVSEQSAEQNPPAESKPAENDGRGFVFGSYGRVQPATDLRGGSPKWVNIVGHGSRLEQESYVELDFAYLFKI